MCPCPFVPLQSRDNEDSEDAFHFIGYIPVGGRLYELDGLNRAESNTLWMQQTTLTLDPERRDARDLTVDITSSELLALANGTWRNLTFDAVTGPVRQRSVFAHNLPTGATALSR